MRNHNFRVEITLEILEKYEPSARKEIAGDIAAFLAFVCDEEALHFLKAYYPAETKKIIEQEEKEKIL